MRTLIFVVAMIISSLSFAADDPFSNTMIKCQFKSPVISDGYKFTPSGMMVITTSGIHKPESFSNGKSTKSVTVKTGKGQDRRITTASYNNEGDLTRLSEVISSTSNNAAKIKRQIVRDVEMKDDGCHIKMETTSGAGLSFLTYEKGICTKALAFELENKKISQACKDKDPSACKVYDDKIMAVFSSGLSAYQTANAGAPSRIGVKTKDGSFVPLDLENRDRFLKRCQDETMPATISSMPASTGPAPANGLDLTLPPEN